MRRRVLRKKLRVYIENVKSTLNSIDSIYFKRGDTEKVTLNFPSITQKGVVSFNQNCRKRTGMCK